MKVRKLKALAVTSLKRTAVLPDVPTVAAFAKAETEKWGKVVRATVASAD